MTAYAIDGLEPTPFDERVAPTYDAGSAHMFSAEVLGPTVDVLQELAGDGAALELAIGTGRVALPLAERGVEVHGIDVSEAMVAELRSKPGGDQMPVTIGDMATTRYTQAGEDSAGRRIATYGASAHRYVWPSELDLMARIAGLRLTDRWADWDRSPFTADSDSHVSVWTKVVD